MLCGFVLGVESIWYHASSDGVRGEIAGIDGGAYESVSSFASSAEFMGEFWFGQGSKIVIKGSFVRCLRAKAIRFSGDQF